MYREREIWSHGIILYITYRIVVNVALGDRLELREGGAARALLGEELLAPHPDEQ